MVTDVSSEQSGSPSSGASAPAWAEELLDVLEARRQVLIAAAVGLSLIGLFASIVAPSFVPPRPLVGAAVGIAVVLLSIAITVAADSADLIVRGPRHVRAAGGHVAAALPMGARFDEADGLAAAIDQRAEAGGRHWVALAPASRDVRGISDWADALGVGLSRRDRRVVVIDLYSGSTPGRAGVLEVVHDEVRLARAVDFDRELMLARLGAGADAVAALESLPGLVPRLPRDIEILVVALPPLGQPGALSVAGTLDRVLVFAETDVTTRVDLIAALDALDATDTASEVVLLEPARRTRAIPGSAIADATSDRGDAASLDASDDLEHHDDVEHHDVEEQEPAATLEEGSSADEHASDTAPAAGLDDGYAAADGTAAYASADLGDAHVTDAMLDQPAPVYEPEPSDLHEPDLTHEPTVAPVTQDDPDDSTAFPSRDLPRTDAGLDDEDDDAEADLRATALLHHVAEESERELDDLAVADDAPGEPAGELGLRSWDESAEDGAPADDPVAETPAAAFEDTHEVLPEPIRDADPAIDPVDRHLAAAPDLESTAEEPESETVVDLTVANGDATDHIGEAGRWTAPAGHEVLTGAAVERPRYDDEDDPLRVAAALQTLAQEVWSRDDERA